MLAELSSEIESISQFFVDSSILQRNDKYDYKIIKFRLH